MRNLEIRVRIQDGKVRWKVSPIPNDGKLTPKELELAANALDTVRISVLERKEKKFFSSNDAVEKILSRVDAG